MAGHGTVLLPPRADPPTTDGFASIAHLSSTCSDTPYSNLAPLIFLQSFLLHNQCHFLPLLLIAALKLADNVSALVRYTRESPLLKRSLLSNESYLCPPLFHHLFNAIIIVSHLRTRTRSPYIMSKLILHLSMCLRAPIQTSITCITIRWAWCHHIRCMLFHILQVLISFCMYIQFTSDSPSFGRRCTSCFCWCSGSCSPSLIVLHCSEQLPSACFTACCAPCSSPPLGWGRCGKL